MVASMKPGSVIVDLAVERGGNVEGAVAGEVVTTANDVKMVGHLNVPGRVAASASLLYAKNLFAFVETLVDKAAKTLAIKRDDELVKATMLTDGGRVVHPNFAKTVSPVEPVVEPAAIPATTLVADAVFRLAIFVLAIFVGYYVVWSVTPALHTPLMAVTNAISSVIVVGALIAAARRSLAAGRNVWIAKGPRRPGRRGAGQRQHLRRLPGHPAHAGDVQEEGAVPRISRQLFL
jgi:NAD/NADP transhydrogenase alpha subunit